MHIQTIRVETDSGQNLQHYYTHEHLELLQRFVQCYIVVGPPVIVAHAKWQLQTGAMSESFNNLS